jgi:hypothetical protein
MILLQSRRASGLGRRFLQPLLEGQKSALGALRRGASVSSHSKVATQHEACPALPELAVLTMVQSHFRAASSVGRAGDF